MRIISACCGSYFTAAVTDDGHLYTWGLGDDGQLGCEDCVLRYLPGLVPGLPQPVCVAAAGDAHMACVRQALHRLLVLSHPFLPFPPAPRALIAQRPRVV